MTPESRVKVKVKKLLKQYSPMRIDMPVPGGYGKTTLDFIVTFRGKVIVIETKDEGKDPTGLQRSHLREFRDAGAAVFVLRGLEDAGFGYLKALLDILSTKDPVPGVAYGEVL